MQILFSCYSFSLVLVTKHKMTSPHFLFSKRRRGSNLFFIKYLHISAESLQLLLVLHKFIHLFIFKKHSFTSEQPHGLLRWSQSSLLTRSTHILFPSSVHALFITMKTHPVSAVEMGINSSHWNDFNPHEVHCLDNA